MFNSNMFKVFSISLLICPFFSSAMETEEQKISGVQIYQLLSFISKDQDNGDFHLPSELVQIITVNAHEIICHEKYGQYGDCLQDAAYLVGFIEGQGVDGKDIQSTIDIINFCLDYSGTALSDIQNLFGMTPLELVIRRCENSHLQGDLQNKFVKYCIDVVNQLYGI